MDKIDLKKEEYYREQMTRIAGYDLYHKDCPELQMDTLSRMIKDLIDANKDDENDMLVAFLIHMGSSLYELIKFRKLKKQNDAKS